MSEDVKFLMKKGRSNYDKAGALYEASIAECVDYFFKSLKYYSKLDLKNAENKQLIADALFYYVVSSYEYKTKVPEKLLKYYNKYDESKEFLENYDTITILFFEDVEKEKWTLED